MMLLTVSQVGLLMVATFIPIKKDLMTGGLVDTNIHKHTSNL